MSESAIETFVPQPSRTQSRIRYDLETGIMTERSTSRRLIWIAEDLMQAVHSVTERILRGGAPKMLFKTGRYWGEAMFQQFERQVLDSRPDLERVQDLSVSEFVQQVDQVWSEYGLGRFEMLQNFDRIFVNLYYSYVAQTVPHTGKPMCHLYAGLYSGLFSALLEQDVQCIEIMCLSSGYDYCQFLLGKEAAIQEVEEWQIKGIEYEEIMELLREKSETEAEEQA